MHRIWRLAPPLRLCVRKSFFIREIREIRGQFLWSRLCRSVPRNARYSGGNHLCHASHVSLSSHSSPPGSLEAQVVDLQACDPRITGQSPANVMRTGRNDREPNGRTKRRINDRRRDAIDRRRLHHHRRGSAVWPHINALRPGVIRSGSRTVHNGPADNASGGESANAACRLRPAGGPGSEQPHCRHRQDDRHNRQDFQKLLHNVPSHKMFPSDADSMLSHPALFNPRPSNSNTAGVRESCKRR